MIGCFHFDTLVNADLYTAIGALGNQQLAYSLTIRKYRKKLNYSKYILFYKNIVFPIRNQIFKFFYGF